MLTVADGAVLGAVVIDAHPEMRRNVILAKAELMKLVFMVLIGFYRVGLIVGRDFVRILSIYFLSAELRILPARQGNAYRTLGLYPSRVGFHLTRRTSDARPGARHRRRTWE